MGQITITLPDELEESIRNYVQKKGYDSISEFVRESASDTLYKSPSFWEKAVLIKLIEIQKALNLDINEEALGALKGGYTIFYPGPDIGPDYEMPEEDMRFVMDLLDMYQWLQYSYRKLDDKEKDKDLGEKVKFPGFDGNNEYELLGFVRFLQDNGRWEDLELATYSDGLNSHMPSKDIYKRMLSEYKKYKWRGIEADFSGPKPLTLKQIRAVIEARKFPKNHKKD